MFQATQSEYLRWLALSFCSMHPQNEVIIKNVCIKVVNSVHSVLAKFYCELNVQYAASLYERRSSDPFIKNEIGRLYTDILADDVQQIILNIDILLEEMKTLKSSLSKWIVLVDEEKQSVEETLKLFATEFNKFKIKLRNSNDCIQKVDINLEQYTIRSTSKSRRMDTSTDKHIKDHQAGTSHSVNTVDVTSKQPVLEQKSDERAAYLSPIPISGGYAACFSPYEQNRMSESSYSEFKNENFPADVVASSLITNEVILASNADILLSVNDSNVSEFHTATNSSEWSFLQEDSQECSFVQEDSNCLFK